jgi:hypothetical protein
MARRLGQDLNFSKKFLLAVGGIVALVAPIAIGLVSAPASRAQGTGKRIQFEVASIKPSNSADRRPLIKSGTPGQFTAANVTVKMLIEYADIEHCGFALCNRIQRLSGSIIRTVGGSLESSRTRISR